MAEIKKKLDEKIDPEFIETRDQAGRKLSYLKGAYVIDRLNQLLGQGSWDYQVIQLNKVYEGVVQQRSGEVFATSYTAIVKVNATIDGNKVCFTDVGYGDGTDKANPGKAHELAVKEAVTDGVKRSAKNLGRSMGLELYVDGLPTDESETSSQTKPSSSPKFDPQESLTRFDAYVLKGGMKKGTPINKADHEDLVGYLNWIKKNKSTRADHIEDKKAIEFWLKEHAS